MLASRYRGVPESFLSTCRPNQVCGTSKSDVMDGSIQFL